MSWAIKDHVPTLYVSDLELATAFYGRLGFGVQWEWPKSAPSHLGLRNESCAIMLVRGESSGLGEIYFVVDDVQACFAGIYSARPWELVCDAAKESGGRDSYSKEALGCPAEPTVKEHRHRDFVIVDPWGHRLTFGCEETS